MASPKTRRATLQLLFLLIFAALTKFCATLDIRLYKWLNVTELQPGYNLTCNVHCTNQLLDTLEEVQQDFIYANKTIDIERISARLRQRISDVEIVLEQHSIGFKKSHITLSSSINSLIGRLGLSSNGPAQLFNLFLDALEVNATNLAAIQIDRDSANANANAKSLNVTYNIESLTTIHQRLVNDILLVHTELLNINQNHSPKDQTSSKRSRFADLIEHDAKHLEGLVRQAVLVLDSQLRDNKNIGTIRDGLMAKMRHIHDLSSWFTISRHRLNTDKLVATHLLNACFETWTTNEHNLRANLQRVLDESTNGYNSSRDTLAQLSLLRQSIRLNDEREADEQLLVDESFKDLKNLDAKLQRLMHRLNTSEIEVAKVKKNLDQMEFLDPATVIIVKNLTNQLSVKNGNISQWHKLELSDTEKQLTKIYQLGIIQLNDATKTYHGNWKDLINLKQSVHNIIEDIHGINVTMANINKTVSNLFVEDQDSDWKDSVLTLLNVTREFNSNEASRLEKQKEYLRTLISSVATDMEKAQSRLNDVRDITRHLELTMTLTRCLPDQVNSSIEAACSNSTKMIERISKLVKLVDQSTRDFTMNYEELVDKKFSNDKFPEISTHQDLNLTKSNFARLQQRLGGETLNLTSLRSQTQQASVNMRQSIEALRFKLDYARSLINELKLGRKMLIDDELRQQPGIQLNLPTNLTSDSLTYLSLSFLLKLNGQKNTNQTLMFLGLKSGGNKGKCYSKFMALKLQHNQLIVIMDLGSATHQEFRLNEELFRNSTYSVDLVKVGILINLSVQSNASQASIMQSIKGPHTTFPLDHAELFIGVDPLSMMNSSTSCQLAGTGRSNFTGQIDDLKINGQRVGLWNVIHTYPTDYDQACTSLSPSNTNANHTSSTNNSKKLLNKLTVELGRLVSFSRPKSNMTSSFVQMIPDEGNLKELFIEKSNETIHHNHDLDQYQGQIQELSMSFKTSQANGLLLHHARPDHSSFLSIYTTGGRLMLAFNFEKKIRIESHILLTDGKWHHLSMSLMYQAAKDKTDDKLIKQHWENLNPLGHSLRVVLDDKHLYLEDFSLETNHDPSVLDQNTKSRGDLTSTTDIVGEGTPQEEEDRLMRKLLYFGGVEDKYSPLLRSQQIPTNFHGCIADVIINDIWINFANTNRNQGISLGHCQLD